MPKQTKKYVNAVNTLNHLSAVIRSYEAEYIYSQLADLRYMWDSDKGAWISLAKEKADPPTELIMVLVWADEEIVELVADHIIDNLAYKLLERSEVYRCRPPKQLEASIYLKFQKPD